MKKEFKKIFAMLFIVVTMTAFFNLETNALDLTYSGSTSTNNTGATATTSGYTIHNDAAKDNICGYRFSVVTSSGTPKSGTKVANVYLSNLDMGNTAYSSGQRFIVSSGVVANKKQLANGTKVKSSTTTQSCDYKSSNCGFYSTLAQNPSSMSSWIKNSSSNYLNLQRIYAMCGTNLSEATESDYVLIEPIFWLKLASKSTAATATELAIYGAAVSGGDGYKGTNGNLYNAGSGTLWNLSNYINREFPNTLYVSSKTDIYDAVTVNSSEKYIYRDIIQKGYGCSVLTVKNVITIKKVKIAYHPNGGTASNATLNDNGFLVYNGSVYAQEIKYGVSDDPINASSFGLTRAGYKFAGWKVKSTGKILDQTTEYASTVYAQYNDSSKTTANTEMVYCYLYAEWTPNKVKIAYNPNGGTASKATLNDHGFLVYNDTIYPQVIEHGTSADPFNASSFGLTRAGYQFAGWRVKSTDKVLDQATEYSSTIYAQYDDSSKTTKNTETVTCYLYAEWTPNKVKIAYNPNGGTASKATLNDKGFLVYEDSLYPQEIAHGTSDDPFNASTFGLTKAGYQFAGWKVKSTEKILDENTEYASTVYAQYDNSSKTTANTTTVYCYLYAVWTPNKVKLAYYTNGGTISSPTYTVNNNGFITKESNVYFHTINYSESDNPVNAATFGLTKTGYTFAGWRVKSTDKVLDEDTDYASTVYAQHDDSSKTTKNTETVTCYLYAVWTKNKVKLAYYTNGGTVTSSTYSVSDNGFISKESNVYFHTINYGESDNPVNAATFGLTKIGYTFSGWKVKSTEKVLDEDTDYASTVYAQHDDSSKTTKNTETVTCYLYAQWTANTVKIAYYASGGSATEAGFNANGFLTIDGEVYFDTLKYGESDDPYNPSTFGLTKTGYTFTGWKVKSTGKILDPDTEYASTVYAQHDDSSKTTANTKSVICYLYAVWEEKTYTNTVTHWKYVGTGGDNSNGKYKKMEISSFDGTYNNSVTIPESLIKTYTGYYNTGVASSYWGGSTWSNKDIGTKFTQPAKSINIEYYYQPKKLTVVFYKNDGTSDTLNQTFTYAVEGNKFGYNNDGTPKWHNNVGQFGNWDREGYKLLGWAEVSSSTDVDYSVYNTVSNSLINTKVPNPKSTNSINLYAIWQKNSYTNTITHWAWDFKGNGNNASGNAFKLATATFNKDYGEKYTLTENLATTIPNGFYLRDYYGTSSITGTWDSHNYDNEITQKAGKMNYEYGYNPTSYNIIYELNGGTNNSNNPKTYNVLYEKTFSFPTKIGFEFLGWTRQVQKGNLSISATTSTHRHKTVLNDIEPGTKYTVSIGNAKVTTGTATQFSCYIYDFTDEKTLARKTVDFGSNIKFDITCPDTSNTQNDIRIIFYSGISGSTSGIATLYSNVEINCGIDAINKGCDSVFNSVDELYSELNKRTTGDIKLIANWKETNRITIVPIEPNAPYRENTDVISSFWLVNLNSNNYTNTTGAKVSYSVYNQSGIKIAEDIQNFVCPGNDKNLSFIRWSVPDGYANKILLLKAYIIEGSEQYGHIEQSFEIEPFYVCKTPNTSYADKTPDDFSVPTVSEEENLNARWWQWEYTGGAFVKKEYAVGNSIDNITVSAPNSPTAYTEDGYLCIKSGYGFECEYSDDLFVVAGYEDSSLNHITETQYLYSLLPEYKYEYGIDKSRSFETVSGKKKFVTADEMERQHFTPIYYPDGEYNFKIVVSDCWTPAGMITTYKTVTIKIEGNIYDDWYIGR